MAQFQNHELEYMVDDYYNTTDFEDNTPLEDTDSSHSNSVVDELESDFEDEFELVKLLVN